jgi:ribosome modulation factor
MKRILRRLKHSQGGKFFDCGVKAAKDGQLADNCPYPTSAERKEWLAGFFSVRPQVADTRAHQNKRR